MRIRPLTNLAIAFAVSASAGVASAQTVIVRNAPPGATVTIVMNETALPAVTADSNGDARVALGLPSTATEADVHIYTESCGNDRRVLLVERGLQPPASTQPCDRRDVYGFFIVRPVTTLVVDMARPDPAVFIRQGPVPASWLTHGDVAEPSHFTGATPPKGLVLSAGAGFITSSNVADVLCGTVADCIANDFNPAVGIGATYWLKPMIGVQVDFVKPGDVSASGNGDTYRFHSSRETRLVTLSGNVGGSVGMARIYGRGGINYHAATLSTIETIDDVTITAADGTTQTVKGGTQSFELKTAGWGWTVGGGVEFWLKPSVAVYIDGAR
jgi:hypothetical protein